MCMISLIYLKSCNLINEKQINPFLYPSLQKCDGGSYSEASTVDPVILLETFSQPQNSHLPKGCFTESKNPLYIVVTPNEPVFIRSV